MNVYHLLPELTVTDDRWAAAYDELIERGLSHDEAMARMKFAFSGSLHGPLPKEAASAS